MAKTAATINIGVNVPAAEIRKAEQQLQSLFSKTQSFNKNPIVAKNFTQPLGRITGAANEFNKSLEASNARVIAFGASAGAIFAVQRALSELVKTTIKVEQRLTNIQVLLGTTGKEFEKLTNGLYKAARDTGSSFDTTAESMEEFARQGLNTEESLKRTTAAMVLVKLGGMNAKNATESLTAAMNTFGKAAGDSTTIVNKLAQVDAKFAVSSGDLAEAIKRTGAAAVSANVSFEELIAVVTTAQEKTARGGAVIGNSFKTIFTRIQRPETLKQLDRLGVKVRDSNKQLLPAIQILKNYAKVYDNLGPSMRATSAEMLAGVFQVNVLKAVLPELASSVGKYDRALRIANETTSEATERMSILTSTTEGSINKALVNLTKFAKEVGDLTIKPALDNILKMLNGFADLISPKNFFGLGETIGTAVYQGMGKIISGPGLLLLGAVLVKIGARLAVFVKDAAAGFMGMETASQKLASTQTVIQNILAQRPALIKQATASEEGMVAVARVLADKLRESRLEMQLLTKAAQKAAPAVMAMQSGAKSRGGRGKKAAGGFVPSFNMTPAMTNTAASGFVPNFNAASAERRLASAGGYQAGKIRQGVIPGVGQVTYNGNETVQSMPGLQQPAIMPPSLSSAGQNYRDAFRGMHGYDPYNMGGGFVPNFAPMVKLSKAGQLAFGGKKQLPQQSVTRAYNKGDFEDEWLPSNTKYSHSNQRKIKSSKDAAKGTRPKYDPAQSHIKDLGGKIGLVSMFGAGGKGRARSDKIAKMRVGDLQALKPLVEQQQQLANDFIVFKGVQVAGLNRLSDKSKEKGTEFSKFIGESLADPLASLATAFSKKYLGGDEVGKTAERSLAKQLKANGSYLNPGTEGDLFELAVRGLTTKPGNLSAAFDSNRSHKAPFDFEEIGRVSPQLIDMFGFKDTLIKADAKRSATGDMIDSLVRKTYNQAVLPKAGLANIFSNLPGMNKKNAMTPTAGGSSSFMSRTQRQTVGRSVASNLASGFVPNFAAASSKFGTRQAAARVGAISDAISREDNSGVRSDKVRVGFDQRLKGGIGVYNTDEGSLGNAINMHMANGANKKSIQTMGKAMGFIPNFAPKSGGMEGGQFGYILAAGYAASFGDTLQESDNRLKSFTGSIVSSGASLVMYAATFKMVADTFGGLDGIGKKLSSGFTSLTKKFKGSSKPGEGLFSTGTGSRGRMLKSGETRRRSLGEMFAGRTAGGQERNSLGLDGGILSGTGDRFRASKFGRSYRANRGTSRGSLASLGGLMPGKRGRVASAGMALKGSAGRGAGAIGGAMGLKGGAAIAGGAAAGAAVVGYGVYKLYEYINNSAGDKNAKILQKTLAKNDSMFKKLGETMNKVAASASELEKATAEGDVKGAQKAKGDIISAFAADTGVDEIFNKGGPIRLKDGSNIGSKKDLLDKVADPRTTANQVQGIQDLFNKHKKELEHQQKILKDVSTVYDQFKNTQSAFGSTDLGVADQRKASDAYVSALKGMTPKKAQQNLSLFKELKKSAETLGRSTSTADVRKHNKLQQEVNEAMGMDVVTRKALATSMKGAVDVTNANEEDYGRLNIVIARDLFNAVKGLAAATGHAASVASTLPVPFTSLYNSVETFSESLREAQNKFKLGRGLDEIFEDETSKMFAISTKHFMDVLGKTSSELSKIQVQGQLDKQRIDIESQQTNAKASRDRSTAIFKEMAKLAPKLNDINAEELKGGTLDGMTFNMFDKQIGGKSGLGAGLFNSTKSGNFADAEAALTAAISNTGKGMVKGSRLKEATTVKEGLIALRKTITNMSDEDKIRAQLNEARVKSEKRLIDAQMKAAQAQNELAQRIAFMGGISGGTGTPEKFAREFQGSQLLRSQGAYSGSSDEKTQGMLNVVKSLNSLRIGGADLTESLLAPIRSRIAENIAQGLAGIGVQGLGAKDSVIQKIAKDQVDNLIKPDKTIADVANILDSNKGFQTLNNCVKNNEVQVKVMNFAEMDEASEKIKERKKKELVKETQMGDHTLTAIGMVSNLGNALGNNAANPIDAFKNGPPGMALNVRGNYGLHEGDKMFDPAKLKTELRGTGDGPNTQMAVKLMARKAQQQMVNLPGMDQATIGNPVDPPQWLKAAILKELQLQSKINQKREQINEVRSRGNRVPKVTVLGKEQDMTGDLLADHLAAREREQNKLQEELSHLLSQRIQEQQKILKKEKEAAATDFHNKFMEDMEKQYEAFLANNQFKGKVTPAIAKALQPQEAMGPMAVSLAQGRNRRGSGGNQSPMLGLKQQQDAVAKQVMDDFQTRNEDIPSFIKDFSKALGDISIQFENLKALGYTSAEALKFAELELSELQDTANLKGLKSGVRTIKEVQEGLDRTIDLRLKEGMTIAEQATKYSTLLKTQIKLSQVTQKSTANLDFVKKGFDDINLVVKEFNRLGRESEAPEMIDTLTDVLSDLAATSMNAADKQQILTSFIDSYGLSLDVLRQLYGELSREGAEQGFVDSLLKQSLNQGEAVEKAFGNLIRNFSDTSWYKDAEKGAEMQGILIKDVVRKLFNQGVNSKRGVTDKIDQNFIDSVNSGQDPLDSMDDMLRQYEVFSIAMDLAADGTMSFKDALFITSDLADEAANKLLNVNRELDMLGSYDPRDIKAANVQRAQSEAMQGRDKTKELFNQLSDKDVTPERRAKEVRGMLNQGIAGRMGQVEAGMTQANLDSGVNAFASGLDAKKEVLALDVERSELLQKTKDGTISLNEAEMMLNKTRAGLNLRALKRQFKDGTIDADEYRQGIDSFSEAMTKGAMTSKEKSKVLKEELSSMFVMGPNENFTRMKDNVKDLFMTFREGTKGALVEVISGTSDMRTAFAKVFANLGEKMLQDNTNLFVDNLFSAASGLFTGKEKGGIVGYNSGGMVRGGSGIRDDVPAMLSKGEYVVRKSAVDKYGMGFLNNLNGRGVAGYAAGGSVNLANQYDYNNAKRPTAGSMNVDSQMSAFAQTDSNNPMNQLKFDREQTLDGYLKEKAQYDEMKKKAMMDYKTQRRKLIQSALMQIGMAVGTAALGAMAGGGKKGGAKGKMKKAGGKKGSFSAFGEGPGGEKFAKNFASKAEAKAFFPRGFKGMKVKSDKPGFFSSAFGNKQKFGKMKSFGRKSGNPNSFTGGLSGRQNLLASPGDNPYLLASGGYMGGDRDNIPSLLTGGEYVVKKSAVDAYGVDFFNKVNTGRMQKFASGGLVGEGGSRESSITEGTGGAPSNVSNNFTINITVENGGNVSADTSSDDENKNTQGSLDNEEKNKRFGGAVKDAVIREIVEQKRPGGLLYSEKRTS